MIESKGRFLYVGGFQLPDKNAAAHRVLSIAKILNSLGYEVVFLDMDEEKQGYELSVEHIEKGYITYSQKKPEGMKHWASYVLNPVHVEEVLEKYTDWVGVIAYNYPAMALHKLKRICHKRKIKIYADCTEWYQCDFFRSIREIALKLDTFFRMRVVHKKLDGLIVISNYLKKYYDSHTSIVVIPPLVDKEEKKWIKEEESFSKEQINMAYAGSPGRVGRTKDNLDAIIRSFGRCKNTNLKLHVVGITEEEYTKHCTQDKNILASSEITKKVNFYGKKPHLEALEIIKKCDYTIFYRNISKISMAGFPTKFVESISCGVPVITNQTSDLKKYIKKNRNGFLLDTEKFEDELVDLLNRITGEEMNTCDVEENVFDYRNYIDDIKTWLDKCN